MKAKLEIVPRPADLSRTAPGAEQAALQRDRYKGELQSDFKMARTSRDLRYRSATAIDWGSMVGTFLVAVLAFIAIFTFLLWRDGRLPHFRLWPERAFHFAPKAPSSDWIMSGKAHRIHEARGQSGTPEPDLAIPGGTPAASDEDDGPPAQTPVTNSAE